jgi:hypothetical protein
LLGAIAGGGIKNEPTAAAAQKKKPINKKP